MVTGFDFRDFVSDGQFAISPYDLPDDDQKILGVIKVRVEPEVRAVDCYQYSSVQIKQMSDAGYGFRRGEFGCYLIDNINNKETLEEFVEVAKGMGGDGIASFESEFVLSSFKGYFDYYVIELSGVVYNSNQSND